MTSEERILAYLDGNLTEAESAELLHQLSVSPENRIILEQHLKLNEMTRLAQKPFAVPEELEASLSKRLPIIMTGSQATGTSAPTITKSGSLLSLLRQYPLRFALGGLLLLFCGGAAYHFLSPQEIAVPEARNSISPSSPVTNPSGDITTPTPATTNSSNTQNSSAAGSSFTTTDRSASMTTSSAASSHTIADAAHRQSPAHSSSSTRNVEHRNSIDRSVAKNTSGSSTAIHSNAPKGSSSTHSVAVNENGGITTNNSSSKNAGIPSAQTTIGTADAAVAMVPQTSVLAEANASSLPIQPVADAKNRRSFNTLETLRNPERSNFSARVGGTVMDAFINVPSGNNSYTARHDFGFSLGVDYHFMPEFAVGAEFGQSSILVVSPQTTIETSVGDQLNHIVAHTYTNTLSALYGRLAARYVFAPFNQIHYEVSFEGGALFTQSLSPMVGLQGLLCHTLSDAFEFQGGLSFTGVWSANTASPITTPVINGPTIYKTVSIPANKIFSPTVTIKAGVQYRF